MAYEEAETAKLEEMDFGLTNSTLTDSQKDEVRELLNRYKEAFQWDEEKVSFTHKIKHHITLKPGTTPIKQKNRKFSPEQNEFIDKEVRKLVQQDIVSPSQSSWSSRIVLSWEERKQRYRLCLDYRQINSLSVAPNAHPLPNIEQLMEQFRGQVYFSVIDLFQGYHQVQLDEESRPITAFATRKGLFEFKRLPFGLNSAPTTYQALMESVLGELHWRCAVVYIDDLIIFASSYTEAFERLEKVLSRLKESGLKLRASKCKLFQEETEFLGFNISKNGIKTCRHITQAILDYPTPKNIKDVQRLLGISNYYRSFIHGHSQILAPIIHLTRKGSNFRWTEECDKALDTIKHKLTTPPVRNYYDPSLPIVLTTDASGTGIGATLSQVDEKGKMRLLAYGSRVLKPAEYRWSVTEKEAFAVTFFIKKFRHYLANPFVVFSDHHALKYVSTMRDSSNKIARWLNYLSQFRFEIHHKGGNSREMTVADILSRMISGVGKTKEEQIALYLEKPVLHLQQGACSPILFSWFCIGAPRIEDFEEKERDRAHGRAGKEPQIHTKLKKLQKMVEQEQTEANCRVVGGAEVEYLD